MINVNFHLQKSLKIFDKNLADKSWSKKDKGWKVPSLMPIRVKVQDMKYFVKVKVSFFCHISSSAFSNSVNILALILESMSNVNTVTPCLTSPRNFQLWHVDIIRAPKIICTVGPCTVLRLSWYTWGWGRIRSTFEF